MYWRFGECLGEVGWFLVPFGFLGFGGLCVCWVFGFQVLVVSGFWCFECFGVLGSRILGMSRACIDLKKKGCGVQGLGFKV